jgi:hypothetical protein
MVNGGPRVVVGFPSLARVVLDQPAGARKEGRKELVLLLLEAIPQRRSKKEFALSRQVQPNMRVVRELTYY